MPSLTSDLWAFVARTGCDTADRGRWRQQCPGSVGLFHQAGLLRQVGPSSVVYRPDEHGRERPLRVMRHAEDDVVGVDADDEATDLVPQDAVDWAVSWPAVQQALIGGLRLEAQLQQLQDLGPVWHLGRLRLDGETVVTVHLAATGSPANLGRSLDGLIARAELPGVILVPDASRLGGQVHDRARIRRLVIVSLAERIALQDRLLVGHPTREAMFSELRDLLGLAPVDRVLFAFEPAGDGWDLVYDGVAKRVRHKKGMLYLALLLDRPKQPVPATKLAALVAGVDERVFKSGGGRQKADDTLKFLHERLVEIANERDEAKEFNDDALVVQLDEEKAEIIRTVAATTNLRGEERPTDDGEKARQAVAKAIREAIAAIHEHLPTMADHLTAAISTGHAICYAPKEGAPAWVM